jgi:hypothetical protein
MTRTGYLLGMLQDLNFARDEAGNVLSILDPTTLGGTAEADNQCFAYDAHRRMTEVWTPKSADCATSGRTTANLDGAAPYWTSYIGNFRSPPLPHIRLVTRPELRGERRICSDRRPKGFAELAEVLGSP